LLAAIAVSWLCSAGPARAALVYTGSNNSAISFGATNYGGGAQITPKWIPDNVTGLNDILASPGGTFQLANPVVGNNVASVGPAAYGPGVSQFLNWTGGVAPLSGAPFGTGSAAIYGPAATFALTDATPGGGGTASYGIETWNSYYTQTTAYHGTFGTFLSIGGNVGLANSSAVAALQTEVYVTSGGVTTPYAFAPLILAIGNVGGGLYSYVALSQANALSGAAVIVNPLTGGFSGLAIDNYAANFAAGSTIKVTSTLTFYADPASIDVITPDLSLLPGLSLPGESFGGSVPEPGSVVMGGTAMLALSLLGWMRRRARRAA
jgi:hypothetical protein